MPLVAGQWLDEPVVDRRSRCREPVEGVVASSCTSSCTPLGSDTNTTDRTGMVISMCTGRISKQVRIQYGLIKLKVIKMNGSFLSFLNIVLDSTNYIII